MRLRRQPMIGRSSRRIRGIRIRGSIMRTSDSTPVPTAGSTPRTRTKSAAGPRDPGSWNRYAYVQGDPVNAKDPRGLFLLTAEVGDDFDDDGEDFYFDSGEGCSEVDPVTGYYYSCGLGYLQKPFVPPPPRPYAPATTQQESDSLGAAYYVAEGLLANPDCAGLFNLGGVGLSPGDLLTMLYQGNSNYGSFNWQNLGGSTEASTNPAAGNTVVITLNDNLNGLWFTNTGLQSAQTLLHELGHAYQFIYGAASTKISGPDGNLNNPAQAAAQNANNNAISQNCNH